MSQLSDLRSRQRTGGRIKTSPNQIMLRSHFAPTIAAMLQGEIDKSTSMNPRARGLLKGVECFEVKEEVSCPILAQVSFSCLYDSFVFWL